MAAPSASSCAALHQLPRAVGQLGAAVDQVAGAVVQVGGAVGQLAGPVDGVADAVVDGREAHVDLVQVLLQHVRAQRFGQCRPHGLGEVAAHVVDRVVGGHGEQGGGRLLGVPAEGGDVRGEVRRDLDRRAVGAVGEAALCLGGETSTKW